jgi:DNA-binding IclR family transcriptional regulator
VRGPQRLLLAVVTVLGFPHEITRDRIPALSPALLKAARQMERALARLPAMETPGREESAL